MSINRRELLAVSAGVAAALTLPGRGAADAEESPKLRIVDTNVSLFRWPFRRFPLDQTGRLARKLQSLGVSEVWAGSFEGVFHRDVAGVNDRLAAECIQSPLFEPIGCVNLSLPGWQTDVHRCFAKHNMIGLRVHPNYHGYTLGDDVFGKLLNMAAEAQRFVQIAVSMEDTRTQNESMMVPDVNVLPLFPLMKQIPDARVQLLNYRPSAATVQQFREVSGIYFDTARVDGTDGVPQLVNSVGEARILFGSHAPFLIPEAGLIRTHESGLLDQSTLQNVLGGNANRFRKSGVA